MDDKTVPPEAETIPTADLLAIVRKAADKNGWCDTAEATMEEFLDIEFGNERFEATDNSPKELSKAKVAEAARDIMRENSHRRTELRPLFAEISKKLGVDLSPAYRLRVTVMLDADEIEGYGTVPLGDDGKPSDMKNGDLLEFVQSVINDIPFDEVADRLTVSVAR